MLSLYSSRKHSIFHHWSHPISDHNLFYRRCILLSFHKRVYLHLPSVLSSFLMHKPLFIAPLDLYMALVHNLCGIQYTFSPSHHNMDRIFFMVHSTCLQAHIPSDKKYTVDEDSLLSLQTAHKLSRRKSLPYQLQSHHNTPCISLFEDHSQHRNMGCRAWDFHKQGNNQAGTVHILLSDSS